MKKEILIQYDFSNTEIDNTINLLPTELTAIAEEQGKYSATMPEPLSHDVYRIQILDSFIIPKTQQVIDIIREKLLLASKVMSAKQFEQQSKKEVEMARADMNKKELQIIELKRSLDGASTHNNWLQFLILLCCLGIAGIDSSIAYNSFRSASFSIAQSVAFSAAVFLLTGFAGWLFNPWIMKAKEKEKQSNRGMFICTLAGFIFMGISYLRAEGLNGAVSIDVNHVNTVKHSYFPLFLISYGLFLFSFFIHHLFSKSKADKQKELQVKAKAKEIITLESEIALLTRQIMEKEQEIIERKDEVQVLWDYYHKLVLKVQNIGKAGIAAYKQAYTRYTKKVPDFFLAEDHIEYDIEIKFYSPEK